MIPQKTNKTSKPTEVRIFILGYRCPPIDNIMRLMTIWRITGKIIRTAITFTYAH